MSIDFSKELKNFEGKPMVDDKTNEKVTLGFVCIGALLATDATTEIDSVEKLKRYNLALDIHKSKKERLLAEEVVLLKELIGKYFTTLIVGQALPLLEQE